MRYLHTFFCMLSLKTCRCLDIRLSTSLQIRLIVARLSKSAWVPTISSFTCNVWEEGLSSHESRGNNSSIHPQEMLCNATIFLRSVDTDNSLRLNDSVNWVILWKTPEQHLVMLNAFPPSTFEWEFPVMRSKACFHWLSVHWCSIIIHCGTLLEIPLLAGRWQQVTQRGTYNDQNSHEFSTLYWLTPAKFCCWIFRHTSLFLATI